MLLSDRLERGVGNHEGAVLLAAGGDCALACLHHYALKYGLSADLVEPFLVFIFTALDLFCHIFAFRVCGCVRAVPAHYSIISYYFIKINRYFIKLTIFEFQDKTYGP